MYEADKRPRRGTVHLARLLGAIALVGCATEAPSGSSASQPEGPPTHEVPPAAHGVQRPAFCARDRADVVRDVFCAAEPPQIRSLRDLQSALDLRPDAPSQASSNLGQATSVIVLGHSTALSGHGVSPINPRLLILGPQAIMAYQRGVQKVEVIATARNPGFLNFYLFEFEQACNRGAEGCRPGDLFTPQVERDWLSVRIRDDEDLANTPSDCRQCHQRAREEPALLMRELENPWTHFFQPSPGAAADPIGPGVQGHDLLADYVQAKGDEPYGGFSMVELNPLAPFRLELAVGPDQPVLFDAPGIENERWPYDPAGGYPDAPASSPTWEAAYAAFKAGEQLALPYLEPRVTDAHKHAALSDAYARYRAGELPESELPDLADIFPDDPAVRARIGLQTEPDASAVDALIQACGSCHNDVLDQSLSRARFNVDLSKLDHAEIERAIERIERLADEPGVMPPPEARQLDPEARERLLEYLRDDPLTREPDPRLVRAAELGMAGGARRRPDSP